MKMNKPTIVIICAVVVLALALALVLILAPAEKTYTLSVVVDDGFGNSGATAVALALVYDEDGKIVAARFDSVQTKFALNEAGELTTVSRIDTKVEQGEKYGGTEAGAEYLKMPAGSWQNQAKAFEDFIKGKTAAEVAALDTSKVNSNNPIVAGCTMSSTTPVFQKLVAEAFAYERNVTFKTDKAVTLGLAINASLSGSLADGATVKADFAAVAMADGKVEASMLDSAEASYTLAVEDGSVSATPNAYKGTKNEQGDAYDINENVEQPMPSGRWYAQAQAFANTAVDKTAAELKDLSTDKIEGSCSIYTGGYKAAIVRAAEYAR